MSPLFVSVGDVDGGLDFDGDAENVFDENGFLCRERHCRSGNCAKILWSKTLSVFQGFWPSITHLK